MTYRDDPGAQWASDPSGRYDYRYWDGTQWTGYVKNGGPLPTNPPRPRGSQPPERQAPDLGATELADDDRFTSAESAAAATSGYEAGGYATGSATTGRVAEDDEYRHGVDTRPSFWAGVLVGGSVVLVASIAAFLLLDRDKSSSNRAATVATTLVTAPTTTLAPTTTTTVNPGRAPAQVRVRVINATGSGNLATQKMAQLTPLGYQNAGVADGTSRKGTAVQCRSGFELEAATLAKNVADGAVVEPFPATPPTGSTNADCLVILGTA